MDIPIVLQRGVDLSFAPALNKDSNAEQRYKVLLMGHTLGIVPSQGCRNDSEII